MREILFRGKRTDNGEWVEGYYAGSGGSFILKDNGLTYGGFEMFEVVPETVCQYTDLTDKNGRKIFGGDIVSIPGKKNHNVKFEYGQFCIGLNWPIVYSRRECEVIGNIFDNPELA